MYRDWTLPAINNAYLVCTLSGINSLTGEKTAVIYGGTSGEAHLSLVLENGAMTSCARAPE
jgi:hypothetical protein